MRYTGAGVAITIIPPAPSSYTLSLYTSLYISKNNGDNGDNDGGDSDDGNIDNSNNNDGNNDDGSDGGNSDSETPVTTFITAVLVPRVQIAAKKDLNCCIFTNFHYRGRSIQPHPGHGYC